MRCLNLILFSIVLFFAGGCAEKMSPSDYISETVWQAESIAFDVAADRDSGNSYGEARVTFSRLGLMNYQGKSCDLQLADESVLFKHSLYYSYRDSKTYRGYDSTMCVLDASLQLRYSEGIPVYRLVFTPRRNIGQSAINKLPALGVAKLRSEQYLPFRLPDDRNLVKGQIYTDWTYCAACLAKEQEEPASSEALGEFFRKLKGSSIGASPSSFRDGHIYNYDYLSAVEFITPSANASAYEAFGNYFVGGFPAAKFNTKDALLARSKLIELKKKDEMLVERSNLANKSYREFIDKTYEPLTAKHYLRFQLNCGDYNYKNVNRSPRENAEYIPGNKHYLSCLSSSFKNYDLTGYIAKYPELMKKEAALWNNAHGISRTAIGTPEEQVQVFKKRYETVQKETDDMIYDVNQAAERSAQAERSRQGWANVFNNAMAEVRQDNQFIADHGLVVNSDNTVTTVKQARENAIEQAKAQAMVDSMKHHSTEQVSNEQVSRDNSTNSSSASRSSHAAQVVQDDTNSSPSSSDAKTVEDKAAKENAEKERLAKEKAKQEKLAQEKAEREKAEQERLAKEKAERERIVYTVALTWQNKVGKWFACGPVQCTLGEGDDTEEEALAYVTGNKSIGGKTRVYRCNQYALSSMAKDTAGDISEAKIRQLANCRVGN